MYNKEIKNNDTFKKAQELADTFTELEGRRPRIMIANVGEASHETKMKTIATGFADLGFDVDISPLAHSSQEIAKQAIENDVHILAILSQTADYKNVVPQLMEALKNYERDDMMVIVYSEMPKENHHHLLDAGVTAILDPNSKISDAAINILDILIGKENT